MRILLGGSGRKYVGSGLLGDLTLTLSRRALAPHHAWWQDSLARCPPGGVYHAGGKGGRRGGNATPPGSPPQASAAGRMLPRSLLPPLPGLNFPPTQPTLVPRTSLDIDTPHLLSLRRCYCGSSCCCCSCRGALASASASASLSSSLSRW